MCFFSKGREPDHFQEYGLDLTRPLKKTETGGIDVSKNVCLYTLKYMPIKLIYKDILPNVL